MGGKCWCITSINILPKYWYLKCREILLDSVRHFEWSYHAHKDVTESLKQRSLGKNNFGLEKMFSCKAVTAGGLALLGVWTSVGDDDVIQWKQFPCYWSFVRRIHWSPVNSPHKGQWRGAFMISLICAWTKDWVNTRDAGNLRRCRAHYDDAVMDSDEIICVSYMHYIGP